MNGNLSTDIEVSFGAPTPIFRVRDLAASLSYYVNVLGFRVDWHDPGMFASITRGRCGIYLCQGDQGYPGTWIWIGVSDVEQLHTQYLTKGALIRQGPTNFSWACEIQVSDPDGHVLRFGSEPIPGQPFGPWLDMAGVLWEFTPNGQWVRLEDPQGSA